MVVDRPSITLRTVPTHIRDAVRPTLISRAQQRPPRAGGGSPMVGHSPLLSAGPAHRDPSGYAAYRRCNALPRFSGSHADAFPITESSNRGTHAVSCRSPVHISHSPLGTMVAISAPLAPAPRSTHPGVSRRCCPDREAETGTNGRYLPRLAVA